MKGGHALGLLGTDDDPLHSPSEEKSWRESYYFNFVNDSHGISDFVTIGLMPVLYRRWRYTGTMSWGM